MKKAKSIFCILILCFCLGLPPSSQAKEISVTESSYRAVLLELIGVLKQQILFLQTELEKSRETEPHEKEMSSIHKSVDEVIVYTMLQPAAVSGIKNQKHQEYFARVFEVFPEEYAVKVRRLEVFSGTTEFDAFVETLPPDNKYWLYAAHEDLFYNVDSESNTELIVHELAHVISYEEIIGVPKPSETICAAHFRRYGCPPVNSYLGQFVQMFWSDDEIEQATSDFDSFYKTHKDKFVSEYAAQNPEEDFAESFLSFVLGGDEVGGGADNKINFFNQYPKMVSVRTEILKNIQP